MFALPTLIQIGNEEFRFYNGYIIQAPVELTDKLRIAKYVEINKPGWGLSEFGYHYFCKISKKGVKIIIPAIILTDETKSYKKFHKYNFSTNRMNVERYVDGIFDFYDNVEMHVREDLNVIVHDLRGFSNKIYNFALEGKNSLGFFPEPKLEKNLNDILSVQGMLKMRTDALDFIGNPASVIEQKNIPVFKKVHRVVRCFTSEAYSDGKSVFITGSSFNKVNGPDILELIPYALIDNAIKYAPRGSQVEVGVRESLKSVQIDINSEGPLIEEDELEKIFDKGFRGRSAVETGKSGSGVGLHMTKKLVVEHFGGSISVQQSNNIKRRGDRNVFDTKFSVILPVSELGAS